MPDKQDPVMDTAICSSITRAAGLGDTFWRANLRDVAVMAMSSDQNQSLNRPSGKGKAVAPGMPKFFFLFRYNPIPKNLFLVVFSLHASLKYRGKKKKTPMQACIE